MARTLRLIGPLLAAAILAACQSGAEPAPAASPRTEPSAAPSASPGDGRGAAPSASCEAFGSTADRQSGEQAMSQLTGAEMRIGRHECFDRYVFQMQGGGAQPGWRVGYRERIVADPSGEPVDLAGNADLEVLVRVWTVDDYTGRPAEQLPFRGPRQLSAPAPAALREARLIGSFEGVTQIGLGVDERRPFRVTTLSDPPRLVVDISTS